MGLDNMRGSYYGRCPPFLVAGLLVICLILMFNWWSLSAQNYDLIKQLEDLSEQLKISSEEQDLCVRQRLSFEGRIKTMEEETAQLRVRLEQQRSDNDELKKQLTEKDDELKSAVKSKDDTQGTATRCTTELESLKKLDISKDGVIASLRIEKERLSSQLEEHKQEAQKYHVEAEQVRAELNTLKQSEKHPPGNDQPQKPSTVVTINDDLYIHKVEVDPAGMRGLVYHTEPILPRDPPDAIRPKPRLSVTYLHPAASAPLKGSNVGISVGGDHARSQFLDMDKVENEDNHAAERGDEANVEPNDEVAVADQLQDAERMVVGNEDEDPATGKKANPDIIAHT